MADLNFLIGGHKLFVFQFGTVAWEEYGVRVLRVAIFGNAGCLYLPMKFTNFKALFKLLSLTATDAGVQMVSALIIFNRILRAIVDVTESHRHVLVYEWTIFVFDGVPVVVKQWCLRFVYFCIAKRLPRFGR